MEEFRGADFSDGDHWLTERARGSGRSGAGGAEAWIRAGHIAHMSYVVRQLMGMAG
ncbi:hypothetical protein [Streptomyces coryli]